MAGAEQIRSERARSVVLTDQMRAVVDAAAGRDHTAGGAVEAALNEVLDLVEADLVVWAVVFSNYEPPEVESLWSSAAAARARALELGGPWGVERWPVAAGWPASSAG